MSMFKPLRGAVRLSVASIGLFFLTAWHTAHAQPLPSAAELQQLAPNASLSTLALALTAYTCASHNDAAKLLTVIDYSKASRDKRLWVFDLRARKLLFEEWVAHGKNSGADVPTTFSNAPNLSLIHI